MYRTDSLQVLKVAVIWSAVAAGTFLLWQLREALLLAFGAVVAAIFLRLLAAGIARWGRLPDAAALVVTVLLGIVVCGATLWLFGKHLGNDFTEVTKRVKEATDVLQAGYGNSEFGRLGAQIAGRTLPELGRSASQALSAGVGAVETAVIVIISALYLAARPRVYRDGLLMLVAPRHQTWAGDTLDALDRSLRLWLLGQFTLMLLVGVLSLIAVVMIGLPGPLALGAIAGVTEIVPYLGPFIGGAPAILVAFTQGLDPALYTVAAYLMIHVVEGYFVGPLVQRYFVKIPPALMLFGIVVVTLIFGPIGFVLAAPITVTFFILVKMLYVRDTLAQATSIPGEL